MWSRCQKLIRAQEWLRLNRTWKVSIIYTWLVKTLVRDLALDLRSVPWIHLVPHEIILDSIDCHNNTSTYKRKAGMTCSHNNENSQRFVKLEWQSLDTQQLSTMCFLHSKNRIVILTIKLLSSLQTSELRCMDTVNCQDGMIMWMKVGWEWGKDYHVVLRIVMNCVHSSELTNWQSLWQFLFYSSDSFALSPVLSTKRVRYWGLAMFYPSSIVKKHRSSLSCIARLGMASGILAC